MSTIFQTLYSRLTRQYHKSLTLRVSTFVIILIFLLHNLRCSIYGIKLQNDAHDKEVASHPLTTPHEDSLTTFTTNIDKLPEQATLRQELHFQFPYDAESPFPQQIWQTWKDDYGSPKFKPKFMKYVKRWKDTNPDQTHNILSDEVAFQLIDTLYSAVPSVVKAFHALPKNILKADFFRYLILFARGGVYADIDTMGLKPVSGWVSANSTIYGEKNQAGLVIGVEADPDREDWNVYYAKRVQFCQWTIQAKPGHPALGELIARITEITLQKLKDGTIEKIIGKDAGDDIMNWTGPGIFTDELFKYFNSLNAAHGDKVNVINKIPANKYNKDLNIAKDGIDWKYFTLMSNTVLQYHDVLVLPITSFSPDVGHMGSEPSSHPMSYVKHMFEGSWKPENERHIGDVNNDEKDEKAERRGHRQ